MEFEYKKTGRGLYKVIVLGRSFRAIVAKSGHVFSTLDKDIFDLGPPGCYRELKVTLKKVVAGDEIESIVVRGDRSSWFIRFEVNSGLRIDETTISPSQFKTALNFTISVQSDRIPTISSSGDYSWYYDRSYDSELTLEQLLLESISEVDQFSTSVHRMAENLTQIVKRVYSSTENKDSLRVARSIEFAPEHYQSGISILSYFGTVLKQKSPNLNAKVLIEQDGNTVRMTIEHQDKTDREVIEKTLHEYGLVITGNMQASEYMDNPFHVQQLETKLQVVHMELELTKKQLGFERSMTTERIGSLEEEVKFLRSHIGEVLTQNTEERKALLKLLSKQQKNSSTQVLESMAILMEVIESGQQGYSEDDVKEALVTIRQENPGLFGKVKEFAFKANSTAAGRFLYEMFLAGPFST